MTWGQAGQEIVTLAAGLVSLGLQIGDRVAIASSTRLEWILADSAIMCAGGATTTIYPNTHVEDVVFILADSGSRILFAENADQAAKAANDRDRLPDLMAIVVIDGPGDGDLIITLDALRALGASHAGRRPPGDRRPGRPPDPRLAGHPDLHLGDDWSAQGRRADPPQLGVPGRLPRRPGHHHHR